MKRIAIFSDNLRVGGIQKSLANLLVDDALKDYETDVFLFDRETFFDLSGMGNRVHLHYLKPFPGWCKLLPFGLVRRLFAGALPLPETEYELAVDFDSYQNATAMGALGVKAKKRVMWIHNDVGIKRKEEKKYDLLFRIMKGKYKHFDAFAAVSPGIVPSFRRETGMREKPVTVIQNLIDAESILEKSKEETSVSVSPERVNLVSVGRLCHQKGYDLLLEDFALAHQKREELFLYLIGDGPDRSSLQEKVRSLGLEKAVCFLGNLPNPFPVERQMDAFCLTSRYEGQGMVLWEARALGLPLIFPKRLEQYNPGLSGCDDVKEALLGVQKGEKTPDSLTAYNDGIRAALRALVEKA
ncbi:MAG: glycosyltransferase [Clostridia bacterium]|nr:glycosyltransferase [Clostridia bacterium]